MENTTLCQSHRLQKAFDSFHRDTLWEIMRSFIVPDKIVTLILCFYTQGWDMFSELKIEALPNNTAMDATVREDKGTTENNLAEDSKTRTHGTADVMGRGRDKGKKTN